MHRKADLLRKSSANREIRSAFGEAQPASNVTSCSASDVSCVRLEPVDGRISASDRYVVSLRHAELVAPKLGKTYSSRLDETNAAATSNVRLM